MDRTTASSLNPPRVYVRPPIEGPDAAIRSPGPTSSSASMKGNQRQQRHQRQQFSRKPADNVRRTPATPLSTTSLNSRSTRPSSSHYPHYPMTSTASTSRCTWEENRQKGNCPHPPASPRPSSSESSSIPPPPPPRATLSPRSSTGIATTSTRLHLPLACRSHLTASSLDDVSPRRDDPSTSTRGGSTASPHHPPIPSSCPVGEGKTATSQEILQEALGIPGYHTEEWLLQFFKTKECPYHKEGRCLNGDNCRFAHSEKEKRNLPDLRCTKLCESYVKRQRCTNPRCSFAHSPVELRTSSMTFYKVSLCNFYKKGRCWNGPHCRFAHGVNELRATLPLKKKSEGGLEDCDGQIQRHQRMFDDCNTSTNILSTRRPDVNISVHPNLHRVFPHPSGAGVAEASTTKACMGFPSSPSFDPSPPPPHCSLFPSASTTLLSSPSSHGSQQVGSPNRMDGLALSDESTNRLAARLAASLTMSHAGITPELLAAALSSSSGEEAGLMTTLREDVSAWLMMEMLSSTTSTPPLFTQEEETQEPLPPPPQEPHCGGEEEGMKSSLLLPLPQIPLFSPGTSPWNASGLELSSCDAASALTPLLSPAVDLHLMDSSETMTRFDPWRRQSSCGEETTKDSSPDGLHRKSLATALSSASTTAATPGILSPFVSQEKVFLMPNVSEGKKEETEKYDEPPPRLLPNTLLE